MQQKKIVVLEGNGETAAAVASELRAAGFDVSAVSDDGAKAEEIVREYDPDAIIVSMTLKNVDGFGVLEKLRELRSRAKVVASGNFSDDETDLLVSIMTAKMNPAEKKRVEMLRSLSRRLGAGKQGRPKKG